MYAVVDEKDLSVAVYFAHNGFAYDVVVPFDDFGENGITVGRRCVDDGEVACTHERKLQRARNGCSCQCECVNIHFQLFEFFFGADAKFLLLVDDE